jgi:hypothetical protein
MNEIVDNLRLLANCRHCQPGLPLPGNMVLFAGRPLVYSECDGEKVEHWLSLVPVELLNAADGKPASPRTVRAWTVGATGFIRCVDGIVTPDGEEEEEPVVQLYNQLEELCSVLELAAAQ